MAIDDINPPTLYEVSQLSRDYGLVGERDTHLVVFLSFLDGGFVIMLGLAAGGKDAVVDAAEFCTPGGSGDTLSPDKGGSDWVFKVPTSLSKTVLFQKTENAGPDNPNNCRVHRHMDISSIRDKQFLEDMWKRHGEGEPIDHSYTQVMGQDRTEITQTIYPPDCMVLFLAEDNNNVDLNDYPEVASRALTVTIDDSASQTELVNQRQAELETGSYARKVSPERADEIREYVGSIPMHMYGDDGSGGIRNPVAEAVNNQNPLPQMFTEARRDFPRLLDFMRAVCLFHYDERMETPHLDNADTVTMLITPADAWLAMRIFGEKMVLSALNLRDKDFKLLQILRETPDQGFSAAELQMEMRDVGWNITSRDVRTSLENMISKGYVRKDQSTSPILWSATPFATQARREVNMDWQEVVDDTRETVYDTMPDSVADEYESRFLEGEGLFVTHPFTGETVNLTEETANELENKVEEREAEETDAFAEGLYDSDDTTEEANTQGTLG